MPSSWRRLRLWPISWTDSRIRWNKVAGPIIPSLGPVEIVGYHVVVVDVTSETLAPGKTKTALDADLSRSESTFLVPKQYLEPGRIYEFEVLATEQGGNQTITEGGVFCTQPISAEDCEAVPPARSLYCRMRSA